MAQLKFYRKNSAPSSPGQGTIWFNTTDKTIQLYTGTEWEKYAGNLKDATWSGNTLTITKHDGSSIALNFSDMASATTMGKIITAAGLNTDGTFKANAVNYTGTTIGGEIKAIDAQLKSVSDLVGTTSVSAQIKTATDALISNGNDSAEDATIAGAKLFATNQAQKAFELAKDEIESLSVTDTAVTNEYVSAVSQANGEISVSRVALPVTGVKSGDKILSMDGTNVMSTLSFTKETVGNDEYLIIKGIGGTEIGKVATADFTADSFLDDVNLDANDNLQFTWKMADGTTKTDSVNISKYIDTYTAGNGLSLSGKQFSVDTNVIATKSSVDTLNTSVSEHHTELVSLAGAKVNGKAIGSTNADGDVSGNTVTLAGSDIVITGYTKGSNRNLVDTDTINSALGKLEAKADDAAAGVRSINSKTGDITIATGSNNGTIAVAGSDVAVYGLKSAAYTESDAYATAAQGAFADSAVQTVTTDNTNQLNVTRTNNNVTVNVTLATKNGMLAGIYTNESTGNGDTTPLITAATVDHFVRTYVSESIDSALTWEEFE